MYLYINIDISFFFLKIKKNIVCLSIVKLNKKLFIFNLNSIFSEVEYGNYNYNHNILLFSFCVYFKQLYCIVRIFLFMLQHFG